MILNQILYNFLAYVYHEINKESCLNILPGACILPHNGIGKSHVCLGFFELLFEAGLWPRGVANELAHPPHERMAVQAFQARRCLCGKTNSLYEINCGNLHYIFDCIISLLLNTKFKER